MNLESDPSALQRLLDAGGPALLRKMIGLYLENTPQRIAAATAGEQARDWPAVERAAHSMKSSSAYLGLLGLRDRAARVEELAGQGGSVELRPLLEEMSGLFLSARDLVHKIAKDLPPAAP